jgi:hypothetical protein
MSCFKKLLNSFIYLLFNGINYITFRSLLSNSLFLTSFLENLLFSLIENCLTDYFIDLGEGYLIYVTALLFCCYSVEFFIVL